jgi:hypothetical protein
MLASLRHRLHETFVRWALRVRPPEPAPIILTQRRVYVLPTRAGLAYATALGVILLGAMNYNLSLGHALVFLLAGLGIVAILHTFRNLVLISIRPSRCEPVFAGGQAQFDVVLENQRSDARTSLRLSVDDDSRRNRHRPAGEHGRHHECSHGAARLAADAAPHHRNHLAAGPGPCLELCRPRPQLPGLSGPGREGTAAALEQRLDTRGDGTGVVPTTSPACATIRQPIRRATWPGRRWRASRMAHC